MHYNPQIFGMSENSFLAERRRNGYRGMNQKKKKRVGIQLEGPSLNTVHFVLKTTSKSKPQLQKFLPWYVFNEFSASPTQNMTTSC